jgi:hypothetical protein
MTSIEITRADVEAEVSSSPWELRKDFENDTDLELMSSLARIFQNGAGEAQEAGSVAEYASSLSERAGSYGSNAIYADASVHLEETYEQLGADSLESVSRILLNVAEEAERVLEFNSEAIEGEHGINRMISVYQSNANSSYEQAEKEYEDFAADNPADALFAITFEGESYTGTVGSFPLDELRQGIRTSYVEAAAEYAEQIHDGISGEIDDYYGYLARQEGELAELGYDSAASPVNIWHSEGRAAYEGEQLRLELEKENPDPDRVAALTRSLEVVLDGVFDENGEPIGSMSPTERAYMSAYMDALGKRGIDLLGNSEDPALDGSKEVVGNALSSLFRPDVGGFISTGHPDAPAVVRELVHETEIGAEDAPGFNSTIGLDENGNIVLSGLSEYQGFSNLLAASTIEPGATFSREIGESALRVQQQFNAVYDAYELGWEQAEYAGGGRPSAMPDASVLAALQATDIGTAGILDVVARSTDGSQEFLAVEENLEQLVGMNWHGREDSAIEVLNVATERAQETPQNAHRAGQIAYNLLNMIGEDPTTWRAMVPKGEPMSDALVDIAAMYIDAFQAEADPRVDPNLPDFDNVYSRDGKFFASFMFAPIGSDADSGMGFLDFVGRGYAGDATDIDAFMLDSDFARLDLAARQYAASEFAHALETGQGYDGAEQRAARIYGNLAYAEAASALNFTEDAYQAQQLAEARRKLLVDTTVALAVAHPVGQQLDKVSDALLKATLKQVYSGAEGELKTVLQGLGAGDKLSEQDLANLRSDMIVEMTATSRADLNYTALGVQMERDDFNWTSESRSLTEGGRLLPRTEIEADQGLRDNLNTAYNQQSVGGIDLRDDRMSNQVRTYADALDAHQAEGYGDVDRELVNKVNYGGNPDSGSDYSRAALRAESSDWLR